MALPEWDPVLRKMLEKGGPLAVARLMKILETGSNREAIEASKIILGRVAPEPKVDSAASRRATVNLTSISTNGPNLSDLLGKAQKRLESQTVELEDVTPNENEHDEPL
jgi:hypothetical protein